MPQGGKKNLDITRHVDLQRATNHTPPKKSYSSVLKFHEAWSEGGRHNLEKKILKRLLGGGGRVQGEIMKKELRNMI